MATSLIIEEERGEYGGSPRHPHNGYWAGDFSNLPGTHCGPVSPGRPVGAPVTTIVPKSLRPVAVPALPAARHSRTSGHPVVAAA